MVISCCSIRIQANETGYIIQQSGCTAGRRQNEYWCVSGSDGVNVLLIDTPISTQAYFCAFAVSNPANRTRKPYKNCSS